MIIFNLDEANRILTVSPEYYRGSGLVGCHRFGWKFFRPRPGNCLRAPQADRTLGHDWNCFVRRNYMADLCKAFKKESPIDFRTDRGIDVTLCGRNNPLQSLLEFSNESVDLLQAIVIVQRRSQQRRQAAICRTDRIGRKRYQRGVGAT